MTLCLRKEKVSEFATTVFECLSILMPLASTAVLCCGSSCIPRVLAWLSVLLFCFCWLVSLGDKDLAALLLTCLPCSYCGHAMDLRFFLCVYFVLRGTSQGSIELLRSLSGPLGGVSGPWGIPLLCFLAAPLEGLTPGLAWVLTWSTLLQKSFCLTFARSLLLLSSYFCGIFPLVASQEIEGVMF